VSLLRSRCRSCKAIEHASQIWKEMIIVSRVSHERSQRTKGLPCCLIKGFRVLASPRHFCSGMRGSLLYRCPPFVRSGHPMTVTSHTLLGRLVDTTAIQ
jgi:hypothetical protein